MIGSNTINNNNNIVLEIQDELEECDILSYPPPIFSVSQAPGKLQTMPDLPLNIAAIGSETESFIAALENWQAQNVHKSKKGAKWSAIDKKACCQGGFQEQDSQSKGSQGG